MKSILDLVGRLTAPFVITVVVLGLGGTLITGNAWYTVGGFFVIAAWVLANTWGKYK